MVDRTTASLPAQKSITAVLEFPGFIEATSFSNLSMYFTGVVPASSITFVTAVTPSVKAVMLTPFSNTFLQYDMAMHPMLGTPGISSSSCATC